MVITHSRGKRKKSGSRYKDYRKKRLNEMGRLPALTKIGKKKVRMIRAKGSNMKQRLLDAETANLLDPKANKYEQVKIKAVADNPANRHFVRRNIITQGSIIETVKGKARVTSRPGQDGVINAVLIS